MATIQDKIAAGLFAAKSVEIHGKSRKYRVFTGYKTNDFADQLFYIGKNGALRIGKTIATSYPAGDGHVRRIIEWGESAARLTKEAK